MEAEVIYVVSYACPHCNAALEVRQEDWAGWLCCPACSHPSLPPELSSTTSSRRVEVSVDDDGPIFRPLDNLDNSSESRFKREPQSREFSTPRLIFITGLALSLILAFIYSLDGDVPRMGIFGFLAIVSFLLLLRSRAGSAINMD